MSYEFRILVTKFWIKLETLNHELFFTPFFHFLSEVSSKEKHKDRNYYKGKKEIGSAGIFVPIIDGFKDEENRHHQIQIFYNFIYFIHHCGLLSV